MANEENGDLLKRWLEGPDIKWGAEITDPVVIAQMEAAEAAYRRNEAWMQANWEEIWPRARGKTLAVAGQQAFIADTPEEALTQAHAAHPEDVGVVCRYVFPHKGPRIYAIQR